MTHETPSIACLFNEHEEIQITTVNEEINEVLATNSQITTGESPSTENEGIQITGVNEQILST